MKKLLVVIAALTVIASVSIGAWDDETWVHYPEYRVATFTNNTADLSDGVDKIVLNQYYVMIPVSNINFMTDGLAATNGSWRSLTYGLVDTLFEQYDALASTNKSARQKLSRTVRTTTGGDVKFTHTFETDVNLGGASTVADE